ncbi:MFS general substrate transporter [Aureobasidium subglaciale]|nr:MFS general substrate transporter [Aureobasidium subglaciale]
MKTIQDSVDINMPKTPPSSPNLSSRTVFISRPPTWRLSSLESILEYKEAVEQEKKAASSITSSEISSSEEATANVSQRRRFRSTAAEVTFCFSMALTQLLAEYMISGFAVILPTLLSRFSNKTTSDFWPATILSLVLCATLCSTARLSDRYGGYPVFMLAVLWFCICCVVAGFSTSLILLDVCRAMQGLAIAAYTPSSFALFGCIYPTGPRRNMVLGIYGASSPLGFFAGIYVSAALPADQWSWYFWIAAIIGFVALIAAYLSVPSDRADRSALKLNMDWIGAVSITSGLILVAYALAASASTPHAWQTPGILAPFIIGIACLASAVYIELKLAVCPLLPRSFFSPKSVKPLMVACVFFYGSFGTWLFTTTNHLRLAYNVTGVQMAAWFAPLAVGGFLCAVVGSSILHVTSPNFVLLVSGVAWVAAPLLLAFGDVSMGYWPFVFPAMACSTLGIDMTYTIANVVLSSVSPLQWQGLAGAVNSTTVNFGIAFSLAITQVIQTRSEGNDPSLEDQIRGHRNCFLFAAASAAIGLAIAVVAIRIPREVVRSEQKDDESHGASQEVSVDDRSRRRSSQDHFDV